MVLFRFVQLCFEYETSLNNVQPSVRESGNLSPICRFKPCRYQWPGVYLQPYTLLEFIVVIFIGNYVLPTGRIVNFKESSLFRMARDCQDR
jgi:hypothetical protein